jgi:hypothetical protein
MRFFAGLKRRERYTSMVYRSPISETQMSCERAFKLPIFVLQIYKLNARFGNDAGLFV